MWVDDIAGDPAHQHVEWSGPTTSMARFVVNLIVLALGVTIAAALAIRGMYWFAPIAVLGAAVPVYLANRGLASSSVTVDFADRRIVLGNVVRYSRFRAARCGEATMAFGDIRWMEICPPVDRGTFRSICIATDEGVYSFLAKGANFLWLMERLQSVCGSRMTRPGLSMNFLHHVVVTAVILMICTPLAIAASYP